MNSPNGHQRDRASGAIQVNGGGPFGCGVNWAGDRLPGAGERLDGDEEDVLHPRRMLEDRDGSVGADEEHASFGGDEDHGGSIAGRQRG